MAAKQSEKSETQGNSEPVVEAGEKDKPEAIEASDVPGYRAPSANVRDNRNAPPQWAQKYMEKDVVWAYRPGDGYVKATVVSARVSGSTWGYYVKDMNGTLLWSDRPTLIKEEDLSFDN